MTPKGIKFVQVIEKMRHAKLGDYEPPKSSLSASEKKVAMDKIPDYIRIVCFAGTDKKPKQYRKQEYKLSQHPYPLAMAKDAPFLELFGSTWGQAGKQNKGTAPRERISSLTR